MMTTTRTVAAAVAALALAGPANLAAADDTYTETFDGINLNFWEEVWSQDIAVLPNGGHPGANLRVNYHEDFDHPNTWLRTTDSRFIGDLAARRTTAFSFDLKADETMPMNLAIYGIGTGWLYNFAHDAPAGVWRTYSVSFDPTWTSAQATDAGWVLLSGIDPGFRAMMTDVSHVTLFGEWPGGYQLDNFANTVPPPAGGIAFALVGLGAVRRRRA
jgi:hypothetical protein